MGATTNPVLRYPDNSDIPDAVQIRNLAEDTHSAIQGVRAGLARPRPRRLLKNGTAGIPNAVNTIPIGWTSSVGDPGNVAGGIQYSGGLFVAPSAGIYFAAMGGFWASNSSGAREMQFQQNGTQRESVNVVASADPTAQMTMAVTVWANAGDTMGFSVRQTSGATLNFGSTSVFCWMQCAQVG